MTNDIRDGIDSKNNEHVNIHQRFDYGYLPMIKCVST